jgi:hypothetical protein
MFEPIDIDSLDFRTRCQIGRMESLTGDSRSEVVRKAIDEYYRRVMASATEEQFEAERRAMDRDRENARHRMLIHRRSCINGSILKAG